MHGASEAKKAFFTLFFCKTQLSFCPHSLVIIWLFLYLLLGDVRTIKREAGPDRLAYDGGMMVVSVYSV